MSSYDDLDSEVIRSYQEFSLASLLFFAMKEGACSEQSSRMTAMDAASKNAGICGSHNKYWYEYQEPRLLFSISWQCKPISLRQ